MGESEFIYYFHVNTCFDKILYLYVLTAAEALMSQIGGILLPGVIFLYMGLLARNKRRHYLVFAFNPKPKIEGNEKNQDEDH